MNKVLQKSCLPNTLQTNICNLLGKLSIKCIQDHFPRSPEEYVLVLTIRGCSGNRPGRVFQGSWYSHSLGRSLLNWCAFVEKVLKRVGCESGFWCFPIISKYVPPFRRALVGIQFLKVFTKGSSTIGDSLSLDNLAVLFFVLFLLPPILRLKEIKFIRIAWYTFLKRLELNNSYFNEFWKKKIEKS